jgi:DNA topoisomerase I
LTAQMESALDAIAQGKQEWQRYLTGWNQTYFEPALEKAAGNLPAPSGTFISTRQLEKSRTKCLGCGQALSKVPTKKLKKGYFLKCEQGCKAEDGSALVQFWSERDKKWQTPHPKSATQPATKLTEYPCPVCGKPLEEYHYLKDGQPKTLLRCSEIKTRGDRKHKDVVFFFLQEKWWSPKLGDLKI